MKRKLLHLAGKTGEIRAAKFRGADHMVVPVVALVEGVVRPANSGSPELALASEFAHTPEAWNARPVMVGHPMISGTPVSAGDPRILETGSIGQVFSASVEDKQLKFDAWIDIARAKEMGGDAESIVTRLEDGEQLEVSVGAFVNLEAMSGERGGHQFEAVWRNVLPDHLALLREGDIGACSIEMGCGTPRIAQQNDDGDGVPTEPDAYPRWMKTVKAFLGIRDAISDTDRREQLSIALRKAENDFFGILAVNDDKTVVYHAWGDDGGVVTFQRSFKIRGDNITLSGDRQEVRAETTFKPASASACKCGNRADSTTEGVTAMQTKEQRIKALIDNAKTPWSEDDRTYLAGLTEERLLAFEQHGAPEVPPANRDGAAPAATPKPATPTAATPTAPVAATADPPEPEKTPEQLEQDYLTDAPESVRAMVARHNAADAARKSELVTVLKTAQDAYSEDELKEMGVAQLERLVKVSKASAPPPDYSGRGIPRNDGNEPKPVKALTWADFSKKDQAAAS